MAGSLINSIIGSGTGVDIKVGDGATILCYSDRHAATIVKVTAKQIHVQQDKATRIDKNGLSEIQEYSYERDETASVQIFRLTKRGWRNSNGDGLRIGERLEYYDPSF